MADGAGGGDGWLSDDGARGSSGGLSDDDDGAPRPPMSGGELRYAFEQVLEDSVAGGMVHLQQGGFWLQPPFVVRYAPPGEPVFERVEATLVQCLGDPLTAAVNDKRGKPGDRAPLTQHVQTVAGRSACR